MVEVYAAVIGACMPTLVPVYRQLRYGDPLKTHTSGLSKPTLPGKGHSARSKQFSNEEGSFERLSNGDATFSPAEYRNNHRVNVSGGRNGSPTQYNEGESYQMDGVMVTQKTVWSEHNHRDDSV